MYSPAKLSHLVPVKRATLKMSQTRASPKSQPSCEVTDSQLAVRLPRNHGIRETQCGNLGKIFAFLPLVVTLHLISCTYV